MVSVIQPQPRALAERPPLGEEASSARTLAGLASPLTPMPWLARALTPTLALALVLALVVSACGAGTGNISSSQEPGQTGTTASEPPERGNADSGSSLEPAPGFDGETIKLGYISNRGSDTDRGVYYNNGAKAYWHWLNEQGGVAGSYLVEQELADSNGGNLDTVASEYARLKDQVALFGQVQSTPPTKALLESLKQDNIIAVPGSWAGEFAGERVLLPVGAAYEYQMINLVDWFATESGLAGNVAVHCAAYIGDSYGESGMRGVRYAVRQLGAELAQEQPIERGTTDFSSHVTALQGAGCTAVYLIAIPSETDHLLAQAADAAFEPYWLASLPSYLNTLGQARPQLYEKFHIALDSPNLSDTSVPAIAEFKDRFEAAFGSDAEINSFHLAGYVQSIAVHALLEKAVELGDLSRAGLAVAMEQLGTVDFHALVGGNYVYGLPANRVPTSGVRIFQFDADEQPNLLRELRVFDSSMNAGFELFQLPPEPQQPTPLPEPQQPARPVPAG